MKMLTNMDDSSKLISDLGSEGMDFSSASTSTKRLIAKGIIKWTSDTVRTNEKSCMNYIKPENIYKSITKLLSKP